MDRWTGSKVVNYLRGTGRVVDEAVKAFDLTPEEIMVIMEDARCQFCHACDTWLNEYAFDGDDEMECVSCTAIEEELDGTDEFDYD